MEGHNVCSPYVDNVQRVNYNLVQGQSHTRGQISYVDNVQRVNYNLVQGQSHTRGQILYVDNVQRINYNLVQGQSQTRGQISYVDNVQRVNYNLLQGQSHTRGQISYDYISCLSQTVSVRLCLMNVRQVNIPNHPRKIAEKCFMVMCCNLRYTELHIKSQTKAEHGKVKKLEIIKIVANEKNGTYSCLIWLYFTV